MSSPSEEHPLEALEQRHQQQSLGALSVDVYRGALERILVVDGREGEEPTAADRAEARIALVAFFEATMRAAGPGPEQS